MTNKISHLILRRDYLSKVPNGTFFYGSPSKLVFKSIPIAVFSVGQIRISGLTGFLASNSVGFINIGLMILNIKAGWSKQIISMS